MNNNNNKASVLVSQLEVKLCELDQRVISFQKEMSAEFENYSSRLLGDVPQDVVKTVSEAVRELKKAHPSIYPEADMSSTESCKAGTTSTSTNTNNAAKNNSSFVTNATSSGSILTPRDLPLPPKPNSSEEPGAIPGSLTRSPHERDKEFRGLFTPGYLPLLEDAHKTEGKKSPIPSLPPTPPPIDTKGKGKEEEIVMPIKDAEDTRSLTSSPPSTRPAPPRRRNTDEVSIKSDWSDGTTRRSALRRSSSISKGQSPRRVRFEVEGEEVLPTSSPAPVRTQYGDLGELSFIDAIEEEESGLEQIEDIDDEPPIPKKMSSSQALRALSRSPLDDNTQWTTVSAPPDGSASVAATSDISPFDENLLSGEFELTPRNYSPLANRDKNKEFGDSRLEAAVKAPGTKSGDKFPDPLSPTRRPTQTAVSLLSPAIAADLTDNKSPTSATRPTSSSWKDVQNLGGQGQVTSNNDLTFNDDDEELFSFDENSNLARKPALQYEEESSESEAELLIKVKKPLALLSRSPAREIIQSISREKAVSASTGIVGSYKGQPFTIPVVNPEIHAQAASMGNINTYIGSIHDRPLNEAFSYSRPAGSGESSFTGAPRSLTERLMMDDIMEAEENTNRENTRRNR